MAKAPQHQHFTHRHVQELLNCLRARGRRVCACQTSSSAARLQHQKVEAHLLPAAACLQLKGAQTLCTLAYQAERTVTHCAECNHCMGTCQA